MVIFIQITTGVLAGREAVKPYIRHPLQSPIMVCRYLHHLPIKNVEYPHCVRFPNREHILRPALTGWLGHCLLSSVCHDFTFALRGLESGVGG